MFDPASPPCRTSLIVAEVLVDADVGAVDDRTVRRRGDDGRFAGFLAEQVNLARVGDVDIGNLLGSRSRRRDAARAIDHLAFAGDSRTCVEGR